MHCFPLQYLLTTSIPHTAVAASRKIVSHGDSAVLMEIKWQKNVCPYPLGLKLLFGCQVSAMLLAACVALKYMVGI
jgi:hypothetical protein